MLHEKNPNDPTEDVMKKLGYLVLGAALSTALVGCGGELDEGEAQVAWEATNSVLTSGSARMSAAGGGEDGEGAGLTLNFDFTCPEGGTANFTGALTGELGTGGFNYTVGYQDCGADGVVINGDLAYDLTVVYDKGSAGTTMTFVGDLDYTGEVRGTCEIDMTGSTSTTWGGGAFTASVDYQGSICGHDATTTLSADGSL